MMNLNSNCFFISVESRKGGVGKTTVSLTLAQCLLESNYEVLLIDLDLSGTALCPDFLKEHREFLYEVHQNDVACNLVGLFQKQIEVGSGSPRFSFDKQDDGSLTVHEKMCNYIKSDIYEQSNGNAIEDPRVINDGLHAFWMQELIGQLAEGFSEIMGKDKKIAVILDNAPGVSSLEATIHDMLTSLGPDNGKFLMVSSIDEQDLNAVRDLEKSLYKLYLDKICGMKYYNSLKGGAEISVPEESKSSAFDYIWNSLCLSNGKKPEYYSKNPEHTDSSFFIQIIVNKVERRIMPQIRKKEDNKLKQLLGGNIVPHISHLDYYFSHSLLENGKINYRVRLNDKMERFKLSGDIKQIVEDEKVLQSFVNGLNDNSFIRPFRTGFSLLYPFERIKTYYKGQELVVGDINKSILLSVGIIDGTHPIFDFIKQFVSELCPNVQDLEIVIHHAQIVLENAGENKLVLSPIEDRSVQHLEEPIRLFAIAARYTIIYSELCDLLNYYLIACASNIDSFEGMDKEIIENSITRLIDGETPFDSSSFSSIRKHIQEPINAREMKEVLNSILKTWKLT